MSVKIGFTLQPEQAFLELLGDLLRNGPDYFEVAPETCWIPGPGNSFIPNGFSHKFLELGHETNTPFVGHGVGFSLGSANPDAARRQRWLNAIREDHKRFQFLWYTDHLGATVVDGHELLLPLGLPYTDETAGAIAQSLAAIQTIVPDVGVENSVFYFHLGEPLEEPAWLAKCVTAPRTHLLLDLHNVYTTALNVGYDPRQYIDALPLDKVIEIHVSGGSWSDPNWLQSQQVLRLDSHDEATPDEVWTLLEEVLPRCPNLRGVTLERMEGTVKEPDAPLLKAELTRIARTLELAHVR